MDREQTVEILRNNGFLPESKFGQNFLCDEEITDAIVELCHISEGDSVLEIGPGIGALTRKISGISNVDFSVVEIDKRLAEFLSKDEELQNVKVFSSDYLKFDINRISGKPVTHIVSNIPYYAMTPILKKLFNDCPDFTDMTFMVEDDALDRIMADTGTKQYGPLAVMMNAFGKVQKEFSVDRRCFYPEPHTLSSVITLKRNMDITVPEGFGEFTDAAFSMRRKKLTNSLKNYLSCHKCGQDTLIAALDRLGFNSDVRAEAISPEQYVELYGLLGYSK